MLESSIWYNIVTRSPLSMTSGFRYNGISTVSFSAQICRATARTAGCRLSYTLSATSSRTPPPTRTHSISFPTVPTSRPRPTPSSSRAGASTSTSCSRSIGTLARVAAPTPSTTSAASRTPEAGVAGNRIDLGLLDTKCCKTQINICRKCSVHWKLLQASFMHR